MTRSIVSTLHRRYVLKTVLPFTLVFLLGALAVVLFQVEAAKQTQLRHARSLARFVNVHLDRIFDSMERFSRLAEKNDQKLLHEQLVNFLRSTPEAQRVFWLDAERNVRAVAPEERLNSSFSLPFERGGGVRRILSKPAPSLVNRKLVVFVAYSLPGEESLVAELDLEGLTSAIASLDPDFNGRAVISDGFGNLISHPDPNLVQTQTNIAPSPLFKDAAAGEASALFLQDGRMRVGASAQIRGLGWRAFVIDDALVFLAPGLTAVAVALACCLLFVAFSARRLQNELREQLAAPLDELVSRVEHYAEAPTPNKSEKSSELVAVIASIDHLLSRVRAKERASREQRDLLRAAFERVEIPLAQYDSQGRFLWTNAPFAALTNHNCEQLQGSFLAEITHPDDRRAEAEQIRNSLAKPDKSYSLDKRLLKAQGGSVWVNVRAVWIETSPPETGYFAALALNIDALKHCEVDLGEERKRFRAMRDGLTDALFEFDSEGRALDVNQGTERFLRVPREKLLGKNIKDLFSLPLSSQVFEVVRLALLDKKPSVAEGRHADGSFYECRVFPNLHGAIMLVRNVTERRLAENALRESEALHRLIFESAPAGLFLFATDGRLMLFNPAFEGLLGYSKAELRGKRVKHLTHPEDLPTELAQTQELLDGRRSGFEFEKRLLRADGGQVWVQAAVRLANQEQNAPPRLVCVVKDIAEKKRICDQFKAAKEAAEYANLSKNDFLANMSQELRTPLNGVFGMLQLLKHSPLPEQDAQYVELALRSARNLLKCVSDIYDISQIEAERVTLDLKRFSLRPLLENLMAHYRGAAEEKDLLYDFKVNEGAPEELFGDEERVRQILGNLLDNAIKYTERGYVFLDVSVSGQIGTARGVLFSVADSGVGIAGERLEQVFAPFTRLDRHLNKKMQGAGLGLSLVRRLTSLMGGNVCVDSESGQGTTVHCLFPFSLAAQAKALDSFTESPGEPTASAVSAAPRALRVLVAEDDQINSLAAKHMLEHLGHRVVCAANGVEALRELESGPFDVAFMDVQMPELDGISATRRIRADRSGRWDPALPIVALTAFAQGADAGGFLAEGMDLVVAKPVTEEALANALEEVLKRGGKR